MAAGVRPKITGVNMWTVGFLHSKDRNTHQWLKYKTNEQRRKTETTLKVSEQPQQGIPAGQENYTVQRELSTLQKELNNL